MIPVFPILGPWYMAQARRAVVSAVTLPLVFSTAFWTTWAEVIEPKAYQRNI